MITRREWLAAGPAIWLGGRLSPSERLNVAAIGCSGRGAENLKGLAALPDVNLVAFCDVDAHALARGLKLNPGAKSFRDWRKMFDAIPGEIDAVVVSTPDHMHAPVSLAALRLGKHVYCEKPLTWSIEEARLMAETARGKKVATQMGTQGMALDGARAGIETIRTGVLGEIRELHVWTDRAGKRWWPQGIDRPEETHPVPDHLDWDLWLGVAPERPYHKIYHPFRWRGWKDFGTGAVGDMGIHNAAMVLAALRLGPPRSAEILETSGLKEETFPAWSRLRVEFAAPGRGGTIPLFWYDGGQKPSPDLIGGQNVAENGAIVVGSKGTLYSIEWTGANWKLLPEEKFAGHPRPEPTLPRAPGEDPYREWVRACTGGPPAFCNFPDFASPLTETMLVANLALRTGEKISWDAAALKARGCPAADPAIRRAYRKGWSL